MGEQNAGGLVTTRGWWARQDQHLRINGGLNPYTTTQTDLEQSYAFYDQPGRPRLSQENMDGVVAEVKYDKGELQEIILHPIVLGLGLPKSQMGMPHIPSSQDAQRILQKLQKLSAPFGTKIAVEHALGLIRRAGGK